MFTLFSRMTAQPLLISAALLLLLWSFLRMVAVEEIIGDNEPSEVFNSSQERKTVYQCVKIPSIAGSLMDFVS